VGKLNFHDVALSDSEHREESREDLARTTKALSYNSSGTSFGDARHGRGQAQPE
jgi:hypothetical protein